MKLEELEGKPYKIGDVVLFKGDEAVLYEVKSIFNDRLAIRCNFARFNQSEKRIIFDGEKKYCEVNSKIWDSLSVTNWIDIRGYEKYILR